MWVRHVVSVIERQTLRHSEKMALRKKLKRKKKEGTDKVFLIGWEHSMHGADEGKKNIENSG